LTTVSTFAAEILLIQGSAKFKYIALSVGTAQLLILAIYGPSLLSHHAGKYQTCMYV
jgi:hypothetical protein